MHRLTFLSRASFLAPLTLPAQTRPIVVRLQVPADVPITNKERGQGEPIRLGELRPGDIIRAVFGGRATGFVAYTIERLGRMDVGVESVP